MTAQPAGTAPAPDPPIRADVLQEVDGGAGGGFGAGDGGEQVEQHFGYQPNREATERFLRELPRPTIRDAGPGLFQNRIQEEKETFLYRYLYKAHSEKYGSEWRVGAQGIGDCVSWGFAHGADIHLAVMWAHGESADWKPAATESIYGGSRVEARGVATGGWQDGSYGAAAAKWLRDYGLVFRQKYDEFGVDLTTYSARRAKDWGYWGNGGQGDNGRLDEEAKKHPVRSVALVTTFEEAAAAIASGYPVPVCSQVGFDGAGGFLPTPRDADGFAKPRGKWWHCMCFVGVRYGDRPGLLCLNSWGPKSAAGPKYPDDMPDGSFWVDKQTVNRMLSQRDSFAVSGHDGFPFRKLDHAAWVHVDEPADQDQETYYTLAL